jgi:hypothetical protein
MVATWSEADRWTVEEGDVGVTKPFIAILKTEEIYPLCTASEHVLRASGRIVSLPSGRAGGLGGKVGA